MVAPVGVSNLTDIKSPIIIIKIPDIQENIILFFKVEKKSIDIEAGIIKKVNTKNTPANSTELVTITPKSE